MTNYYKTQLKKFEDTNLKLWEVVAATEVRDYYEDSPLSDDDFETLTDFVYDWIMNADISCAELVNIIDWCLTNGEYTIADMKNDPEKVVSITNRRI